MRLIYNDSVDPYFNMAAEQYFLERSDEEIVMLWRNSPAVIIGKHQNAYIEVNLDYCKEANIPVIRRLSGGGAVFHDLGNINYSIFSQNGKLRDFEYFSKPIISALIDLGVNAQFSGRNDIMVKNKKISGNAQAKYYDRIMHHGTLLFDGNFDNMEKALKKRDIKFIGKNVASIKKRVGNISDFLKEKMTTEEFLQYLLTSFGKTTYISLLEKEKINEIKQERYDKDSWNIGENVKFDIENEKKYNYGVVKCEISLNSNVIEKVLISGDFFGERDLEQLYLTLKGVLYKISAIENALQSVRIEEYIVGMTKEEFISLLFGE